MTWPTPTQAAVFLMAGAALGTVYFVLLLRTVRAYAGRATAGRIIAVSVARFAAAGAAFWVIAQQGAAPLLLALLGFLIARIVVQRRIGTVR